ncbi:hypothetical protein BH11PSE3_BH11PSE3_18540 [soil metagenome]
MVYELMLRAVLGIAGALLVWLAWPVSKGAWQAQRANTVISNLRLDYRVDLGQVRLGLEALDRAIDIDPTATRHLQRSELLVAAALVPTLERPREQRAEWLRRADADLVVGLANDPGRGVAWLRLAAVRLALEGPSQRSIAPLLMSIDTATMMQPVWPVRLQLILDNAQFLTPEQRERVGSYVARTWQLSLDRRWFANAIRAPLDELFVRYFLRNEPNAQADLTQLLAARQK